MKKVMSIIVVLQFVFLGVGYGAGIYLDNENQIKEGASTERSHPDEAVKDAHGDDTDSKPIIVKLGQMIIPVYKPRSVTYVVINLGVAVEDLKVAEHYNIGENGVRLRNGIFTSLRQKADGRELRGAVINAENLSKTITQKVKKEFAGINDVLFLDFYKKDIARS